MITRMAAVVPNSFYTQLGQLAIVLTDQVDAKFKPQMCSSATLYPYL